MLSVLFCLEYLLVTQISKVQCKVMYTFLTTHFFIGSFLMHIHKQRQKQRSWSSRPMALMTF